MNRLLTRKRGKDGGDIFSKGKKGKKSSPRQELDLNSALPSTENFRTSLLLPNLSARFSMLREQDDPTSLLGKASDDSVLQPKRISRLPDFGYASGLSDIAEVASSNCSVKPPFANQRIGSMASTDGSATDDVSNGSVMNRSRTREGNTLFGGRQKTFKVPVISSGESKGQGGAIHIEDVGLSANYQGLGSKDKVAMEEGVQETEEKEAISKGDALPDDVALALLKFDDDGGTDFANSPSSEYQSKRATSSTSSLNSSGPSYTRASTAATSVASQGASSIPPSPAFGAVSVQAFTSTSGLPEKSMTRSKRLYEQSLDQHYHEQQNSAFNRLNSIQKQRSVSAKALPSLSQSKFSGGERSVSAATLDRPSGTLPLPPPPMAKLPELNTFDIVNKSSKDDNNSNNKGTLSAPNSNNVTSPFMSPVSPFTDCPESRILNGSIEPNDRGKATALGAFNKPRPFDEQQYLERQKQMQQRMGFPPHAKNDIIEADEDAAGDGLTASNHSNSLIMNAQSAVLPLTSPTIPAFPTAICNTHSIQSDTSSTARSEKQAKSDKERGPAEPISFNSQSNTVLTDSLISKTSATETQSEAQVQADMKIVKEGVSKGEIDEHNQCFHQAAKSSVEENGPSSFDELSSSPKSFVHRFEVDQMRDVQPVVDSPTLGPGLNGLVRQHLRNVSNVSSVYSVATAAGMAAVDVSYPMPVLDNVKLDTPLHSINDTPKVMNDDYEGKSYGEPDNVSLASAKEKADLTCKDQPNVSNKATKDNTVLSSPSMEEVEQQPDGTEKKIHNRNGSTETQHERKAFANELINRQRQIQENLRNRTQVSSDDGKKDRAPNRSESRSGSRIDSKVLEHNNAHSPALGMSAPFKAWSAMKLVGRESAASTIKETSSSKSAKSLESSGPSPNVSSASLTSMDKQRERQQSGTRRPSVIDDGKTRVPSLSEPQKTPDSQAISNDEGRRQRSLRDRNMPFRPRGRLPCPDEGGEPKVWNNQRMRGQSEGPKAPRLRRPTIIKAESDGRDRATSESGPTGYSKDLNGKSHSNSRQLNAKEPLETFPRTALLPPQAPLPYIRSPTVNGPNAEKFRGYPPVLNTERAKANTPRNTRIGVQAGLGSPIISPRPVQSPNHGSQQVDNLSPTVSSTNSPATPSGAFTTPSISGMRTVGLPPGPKSGLSPTVQKPSRIVQTEGISGSPISPSPTHVTTTPLSMTIKSENAPPVSRSGSGTPISTAGLIPPDLPTVPITLGSGGPPRKRQVNKAEISIPAFVSSTSTVETVTLEYARQNQSEFPSSIPEISTRRRQIGQFAGAAALSAPQSPLNGQLSPKEQLKANEGDASAQVKPMRRLRQVLSEGHGLYGKARQQQQQQQRQTIQTQQGHSVPFAPPVRQPHRPELISPHTAGEAIVPQRAAMPAAIAVTENGMF